MLHSRPKLRIAVIFLAVVCALLLSLLIIHQAVCPLLAWAIPSLAVPFFDLAVYGAWPSQPYISFDFPSSLPNLVRWSPQCDDDSLVLVTLNGPSIPNPGPSIYDARGGLVWTSTEYGVALNMRVQEYKGQNLLTFWAGKKAATSGQGNYYMLDSSYNLVKKVAAAGPGLHGDLHEFRLTPNGTALITVYNTTRADLTDMGMFRGAEGWITDSMFQELDLDTNTLLFEWSAAAHYPAAESYMTNPLAGYTESVPFDSFHINSVDKDPDTGNYLISSRHTHTISYISASTGEVLWILGGMHNAFRDLSSGAATDFKWQHDARFISTPSQTGKAGVYEVSFFDNGKAGALHIDAPYSKASIVRLDTVAMTAELVQSYASLQHTLASSQGSVSILPESGNVFVGWGASAAWSEFDRETGEVLCEAHISAAASFSWERVKSYRVMKVGRGEGEGQWVGKPEWSPTAKVAGGRVYVSWNGATEVRRWEVQGNVVEEHAEGEQGQERVGEWETVDIVDRTGFEDSVPLPPKTNRGWVRFRVVALDAKGEKLDHGESNDVVRVKGSWSWRLFLAAVLVGVSAGAFFAVRFLLRRRRGWQAGLFSTRGKAEWKSGSGAGVRYEPLGRDEEED